jgi:hypothetical protein
MTTHRDVTTLLLELDAMRTTRLEDHRTCDALRRTLVETQDKLNAEVRRGASLAFRLDAANADVQRLSAMVEELRDRAQTRSFPQQADGMDARVYADGPVTHTTYCSTCGVAWAAHRDDECEKRKAQDRSRTSPGGDVAP